MLDAFSLAQVVSDKGVKGGCPGIGMMDHQGGCHGHGLAGAIPEFELAPPLSYLGHRAQNLREQGTGQIGPQQVGQTALRHLGFAPSHQPKSGRIQIGQSEGRRFGQGHDVVRGIQDDLPTMLMIGETGLVLSEPFHSAPNGVYQLGHGERLGEKIVSTQVHRLTLTAQVHQGLVAGHEDDRQMLQGRRLSEFPQKAKAVQTGHLHVAKDQVGTMLSSFFDARHSVFSLNHLPTLLAQDPPGQLAQARVVVHDQNGNPFFLHACLSGSARGRADPVENDAGGGRGTPRAPPPKHRNTGGSARDLQAPWFRLSAERRLS